MNLLPKSLYKRLLLTSSISTALIIGLLGAYIAHHQGQLATQAALHEAKIMTEASTSALASALLVKDYDELEYTLTNLIKQSKFQQLGIINLQGKVIIAINKTPQGGIDIHYGGHVSLPESKVGSTNLKGDKIKSWAPIRGATAIAWLTSEQSAAYIKVLQLNILLDTTIAAIIAILLVTFFVAISLKSVVSHIKKIAAFSTRIPQNKRELLSIKGATSEINHLVTALNLTSEQLYNKNNELQMLHSLVDYSNDPIFIIDPEDDFKIIFANAATCRHFGLSLPDVLKKHAPEWSPNFNLSKLQKVWNTVLINKHYLFEANHLLGNGLTVPVEISANYLNYRKKEYIAGYFRNITERKKAEDTLKLSATIFEHSSEGMVITDAAGLILSVNPAFTQLTGYKEVEVTGKTMSILKSGKQGADFYKAMWRELNLRGEWRGEIWNRRKNGELYAEWLSINSIVNEDNSIVNYVALFSDITEKKHSDEVMWKQANFDTLTGLPNRQMFHDRLQQAIKMAHRNNSSVVLIFLDLDNFKEVNDTLGHDMGDVLLKEAAQRLNNSIRSTDIVARLGGDEFTLILLPTEGEINIEQIAKKILIKLSKPFLLNEEQVHISASIGIALYPEDANNEKDLVICADQAMYKSKNQGRNCYHYFEPIMQEAAQTRMQVMNDLRTALSKNQFKVFYQPIIELATGQIIKAEALIRWQHPEKGLISPAEFIPIAEESGSILEIGDWVFYQAAAQVKQWRSELHPDFQISVNKSPVQFHHEKNKGCEWFEYLKAQGIPGQSIVVEITEGLLLNHDIANGLLEYHDAGLQVAIDDFGTGYSSMSYLTRFDIDYLKIDQSFVNHLSAESDYFTLCKAIISMAHTLGIKVIAEGIETEEQCELLTKLGCDYGQGYLFGKPVEQQYFPVGKD